MSDRSTSQAGKVSESSRAQGRWGEILAAVTVLLAIIGMAVSSPPFAGPDEKAHQATASYLTVHIWPQADETRDYVSGILNIDDCAFAYDATVDASCVPDRETVWAAKDRIFNYPPVYYWAIGLGQKFAPGADKWMDVGGRVASAAINIGALLLLVLLAARRVKGWGTYLLAVASPMAVFLWAVVNPSGWEVTTGLLFAYLFAQAWWSDDRLGVPRRWWLAPTGVAAAAILFALSRHDAVLWLMLLGLAVVLMGRPTQTRPRQVMVLGAAGLGVLAGAIWHLTHPARHPESHVNPDRVLDPGLLDYVHWLGQIDEVLPDRIRQMVGVLGWLNTPSPQWIVLALLLTWAAVIGFLYARTRISVFVALLGFFGTVFVPMFFELLRWNDWPYWYQGRITLSFTIPFLFLFLLRYGHAGRRAVIALSLVNGFALAAMVWLNTVRYSFGISDYIPLRWSEPGIGTPAFVIGVGCSLAILLLVALRGVGLVLDRRSDVRQEEMESGA